MQNAKRVCGGYRAGFDASTSWALRLARSLGARLNRMMAGEPGTPAAAMFEPMEPRQMLAAAPVVLGGNFPVSSYTSAEEASVAISGDGSFVIAWSGAGKGDSQGIYAQRYNSAGTAVGTNFLVNSYTTSVQGSPQVGAAKDGSFVIAWTGYGAQETTDWGVYGQRYDSAGNAIGANFLINSTTSGAQYLTGMDVGSDGSFVATWQSGAGYSGGVTGPILGQRYDSKGNALGANFVIDSTPYYSPVKTSIEVGEKASFIIAWAGSGPGDTAGIVAQRYNSSGATIGAAFLVNTYTTSTQTRPSIDVSADGSFVIAWSGVGKGVHTFPYAVFAQRYSSTGVPVGDNFMITAQGDSAQLVMAADGTFVVSWVGPGAGDDDGIYAQVFQTYGGPAGPAWRVNSYTPGSQALSASAMGGPGKMVIAWQGPGAGRIGVFAQQYLLDTEPTVTKHLADLTVAKDAPDSVIDLTGYFADGEQAAATLNYSVQANDNTGLVSAKIAGGVLTLDYVAGKIGVATLVVRATDTMGSYVDEIFDVTVGSVTHLPGDPTVTSIVSGDAIDSLDVVRVTFSEAINVGSFSWSDLKLIRDSGANLIGSGSGLVFALESGTTYSISGLAAVTRHVGNYVLTIKDGSLTDMAGNTLKGPASTTFNIGTLAASRPIPVDADSGQTIGGTTFTNKVHPTVEGTTTPGATVTIMEGAVVKGIGAADDTGRYAITLTGLSRGLHLIQAVASSPTNTTTISSESGVSVETTVPYFVSISTFTVPRSAPVLTVGVRYSTAPVTSTFDWRDITLTRNGGANIATSAISITDSYRNGILDINLPASLVNQIGVYTLTVNGAGVENMHGSVFATNPSTTWTLIAGMPSVPVLASSSEGKPGSGYTQYATPTVTGTGSVGSTVEVYEGAVLKGTGIVGSDGKYNVTLSTLAAGTHTLKARATDTTGTVTGYSGDCVITVERATPTITSMSVYSAPRTVPVGSTGIRFSSVIDLATFTVADMVLTRNGAAVPTTGITVTASPTDNKLYTIVIPPGLNTPDGVYVLQVLGAGIKNLAGKTVGNNFSTTWTTLHQIMNMSQYPAPRTTPVTAVGVRFSNPINLSTFTWADITLKRNGGANLATAGSAISIVVSATDPSLYTIVIPAALTSTAGTYVLTVAGAGIISVNGYTMSNTLSTTWTQV